MKKLSYFLIALFLIPASFVFTSCTPDEVVTPAYDILTEYMEDQNMDLGSIIKYHGATDIKFVAGAPAAEADVAGFLANRYVIDIRTADTYALGHIAGAVNVAFADILTAAVAAGDKQLLVVCYTGQTACYATSLLRMYGYPDAQALKWGMTGWSSDFDSWSAKTGDIATGDKAANWNTDAAPTNVKYDAPKITTSLTEGEAILKERVEAVVAASFKTAAGADVLAMPTDYFVNNYFSAADYTGFGHIAGAYRINPLTLADDLTLNINPDAKVVTYCYTGQTSAVITAYLNVIGYDAYSLTFGMNGLNNSSTYWSSSAGATNQWGVTANSKMLPYVK